MVLPVPPRFAATVGLILLAGWLGWIVAGFAALWAPAGADQARIAVLLEQLRTRHPELPVDRPSALLLDPCACAGSPTAWQQVSAMVSAGGGAVFTLPGPDPGAAGIELMVLDRSGMAVYAGPLQPRLPGCGSDSDDPAAWLPGLIDGAQPPLFLTSACSC